MHLEIYMKKDIADKSKKKFKFLIKKMNDATEKEIKKYPEFLRKKLPIMIFIAEQTNYGYKIQASFDMPLMSRITTSGRLLQKQFAVMLDESNIKYIKLKFKKKS